MTRGAGLALVAVLAARSTPVQAQRPGPALGVTATVVGSDPVYGGLGAVASLPLDRQLRLTADVTGGRAGRQARGRGEVRLEFLLDPTARGWSPWVGGGAAGVTGARGGGYLVVMVGLEQRPRARTGWRVGLGVGGGARIGASLVWRLGRR